MPTHFRHRSADLALQHISRGHDEFSVRPSVPATDSGTKRRLPTARLGTAAASIFGRRSVAARYERPELPLDSRRARRAELPEDVVSQTVYRSLVELSSFALDVLVEFASEASSESSQQPGLLDFHPEVAGHESAAVRLSQEERSRFQAVAFERATKSGGEEGLGHERDPPFRLAGAE